MIAISITSIICITIGYIIYLDYKNSCRHKYETFSQINITNRDNERIATKYVLRCENCGKMKTKSIGS